MHEPVNLHMRSSVAATIGKVMIVGKHANPFVLFLALGVILMALFFSALKHGRSSPAQAPPLHQAK